MSRMQLLGDVMDHVVGRLEHRIFGKSSGRKANPHRVPNDPRLEWIFQCVLGKEKAEQKMLILQARHPSVGFLTDADAEILISALMLENA